MRMQEQRDEEMMRKGGERREDLKERQSELGESFHYSE